MVHHVINCSVKAVSKNLVFQEVYVNLFRLRGTYISMSFDYLVAFVSLNVRMYFKSAMVWINLPPFVVEKRSLMGRKAIISHPKGVLSSSCSCSFVLSNQGERIQTNSAPHRTNPHVSILCSNPTPPCQRKEARLHESRNDNHTAYDSDTVSAQSL